MKKFFILILTLFFVSCATIPQDKRISVANAQQLKIGMSSADVVSMLGSPNIITTDSNRNEVWVYDKIGSDSVRNEGGMFLILGGFNSSSSSKSSRTLTIIVKFDKDHKIKDVSYHTTRF